MKQTTIVALYGEKADDFASLISVIQDRVSGFNGVGFQAYAIAQVHATLLGLEDDPPGSRYNRNFKAKRGQRTRKMDVDGYRQFLHRSSDFPFQVQIGGFKTRDYPFTSRGRRPFERSFSIQGDKAVIMGWPLRGIPLEDDSVSQLTLVQESRLYPSTLDGLRRHAQRYNILHAYHGALTDIDNDFYFRIGIFRDVERARTLSTHIERDVRDFLSSTSPLILDIGIGNLRMASYDDDTLPPDGTSTEPV